MKKYMHYLAAAIVSAIVPLSCEVVDDDPSKHVEEENYVELSEVAKVLAGVPVGKEHLEEVHDAVSASSVNGYDEEYTMKQLFDSPGTGVGDPRDTRAGERYAKPLRDLIQEHVLSTKSAGELPDPHRWLDHLMRSDVQIYWPYSDRWDGTSFPIITFDPEDDSDVNIGYRLIVDENGGRRVEEVIVDEQMAMESPVLTKNSEAPANQQS